MSDDTAAPTPGPVFTGEEPAQTPAAPTPVSGDNQPVESPEPIVDAPDETKEEAPVEAAPDPTPAVTSPQPTAPVEVAEGNDVPEGGFVEVGDGSVTDQGDLNEPDDAHIEVHPDEVPEGPVGVPFGMDNDGVNENGGTD